MQALITTTIDSIIVARDNNQSITWLVLNNYLSCISHYQTSNFAIIFELFSVTLHLSRIFPEAFGKFLPPPVAPFFSLVSEIYGVYSIFILCTVVTVEQFTCKKYSLWLYHCHIMHHLFVSIQRLATNQQAKLCEVKRS